MSVNFKTLRCWVVTEGMAGTENQCLGVTDALDITPDIFRVNLRQPWKSLSPWLGFEQSWTFAQPFTPPWPDLLIAAGRKSIAASRFIKKASGGKTFTVQIQDPRTAPSQFDLVAVPEHDPTRGDNVLVTTAAPNRITLEKLERARNDFAHLFALLPSPRVAVLIGGSSKAHTLSSSIMATLGNQLSALSASLMVTTSRRTGEAEKTALYTALSGRGDYIWDGLGDNPYFGMLAWADHILVTEDSVSMLSDAATTGKPVYTIPLEGGTERFARFQEGLQKRGIVRPFTGDLESWSYAPLKDAAVIAQEIAHRISIR